MGGGLIEQMFLFGHGRIIEVLWSNILKALWYIILQMATLFHVTHSYQSSGFTEFVQDLGGAIFFQWH